jgi:hypothetical protein
MRTILRLTRSTIVSLGACQDGLALFDDIKAGQDDVRALAGRQPRRALRLQWDLVSQIWMAQAYPGFFRWLVGVGAIGPVHAKHRANLYGANLTRANLYGANLTGANLDGANLTGANLYGANLTRANLTRANLYGANLYGANLNGANLDGANLYGANLTRANLYGANLTRANLYGANLTRATLYGANLYGANRRSGDPVIPGWRLKSCGCCLEAIPAEPPAVAPVAASSPVAAEVARG